MPARQTLPPGVHFGSLNYTSNCGKTASRSQHSLRANHPLSSQTRLGYNPFVGSIRFGGIQFVVYSNDHRPRHVHGFLGETEVIVDLRADGNVSLAARRECIRPRDAKRADVKKILSAAAHHFAALEKLWEEVHGNA
jgi:hypothetical protein